MMSSSSSTPANTPDPQWQESFGQSFKQFQQSKQKNKPPPSPPLLPIGDKQGWHHICYSTEPVSVPLASVACMSQRIILRLLMYFKEWLTEMTEREGLWLFTLLVYLDPVITSGNLSLLRDLSRRCIALRSDQQEEDPSVPRLNVIITLIAKGFGQADLI
ncbi:survival motor neuron interacting protein 1-domain-containing protein [Spinellus fusiger]|nr:survival motor neuron interacting protein 1-domain-containing protein [Spinellus fusiger]